MPELPEVETIKRELNKQIVGKNIVDVKINKKNLIKEPNCVRFKKEIKGEKVKEVLRKAKVLIIKLREDKFLIIHLRIAGWLLYGKQEEKARVVFKFSNGKFLNYMDQRTLGELRLRKNYQDLKFIKKLGPEPFEISSDEFSKILKGKKAKIKPLLMDQTVVAGIGNIYAQEALFLSKIDPQRSVTTLKNKEVQILYKAIISLLKEAIKHRGSSIDTYRDLGGQKGGMEQRLKVYGRENELCFVCKKPIKKINLGGRGTCFCPCCQR